jgi:hypothetical protein
MIVFSSAAMAADGVAPGHPLYALDRVLETIAIGDGGIAERLDEFDALMAAGSTEEAIDFLSDVIRTASPQDASVVRDHSQAETAAPNQGAADAPHVKIDEIHDSTNAYQDDGTGADGPELGPDVSDLPPANAARESGGPGNGQANGHGNSPAQGQDSVQQTEETGTGATTEPSDASSSPSDSAHQGQPSHAGPKKEHTSGPPEHAGPKSDKDAPANAGPKEKP